MEISMESMTIHEVFESNTIFIYIYICIYIYIMYVYIYNVYI